MLIKLSKEYDFSGKLVKEIELDFDSLTGRDMIALEKTYKLRNKEAVVKELEDGWALTVASRVADINYNDLLNLNATDYLKLVNKTKSFLNKALVEEQSNIVEE